MFLIYAVYAYSVLWFWVITLYEIAMTGSWMRFAHWYRTDKLFPESHFVTETVKVGRVRFWSVVRLSSDTEGLYMESTLFQRAFRPRLMIPWNEISVSRPAGPFPRCMLTFASFRDSPITLREGPANILLQHSPETCHG